MQTIHTLLLCNQNTKIYFCQDAMLRLVAGITYSVTEGINFEGQTDFFLS